MAVSGGLLILALAGTCVRKLRAGKEAGVEPSAFREYGRESFKEGLSAVFRILYPRVYAAQEAGEGEQSWTEKLAVWVAERDPRVRFGRLYQEDGNDYEDPDPSFGQYLDSQRLAEESRYLLFGGGEETGMGEADMEGMTEDGKIEDRKIGIGKIEDGKMEDRRIGNGQIEDGKMEDRKIENGQIEDGKTDGGSLASFAAAGGGAGARFQEIQSLPVGTLAYHQNPGLAVTGTSYVLEQLADYDFLMKHFFSVHSSTTAERDEMDAARLLKEDLSIEKGKAEPQILIYHTHSQETYADYGPERQEATVVGIGTILTDLLKEKGYQVIHDTKVYDLVDGELNRSKAYDYALQGITSILQQYPSIQVVLDIHRDGVKENLHMVSEVNGKPTAQVMFFNGMSQTPEGPIAYLPNGYKEQNLAFSLQMQLDAAAYYPGLTRKIYLKAFRYNLHLRPRSALIEVGAQTNTYEEASNAMEPLAELLDMVLSRRP